MITNPNEERIKQIRESQSYRLEWAYGKDIEFLLSLLDRQAAGDVAFEWFNDWPTINGFYWLRGWRHYGDLPINVDGNSFWMMFNIAKNHRTDLDDSEDVQFLGPITPYSAITAATRMQQACVGKVRERKETWEKASENFLAKAFATEDQLIITALESLTVDQIERKNYDE